MKYIILFFLISFAATVSAQPTNPTYNPVNKGPIRPYSPNAGIRLATPPKQSSVLKKDVNGRYTYKGVVVQTDTVKKDLLVYYDGIVDVGRGVERVGRWAEAVWVKPNYAKKIKKELVAIYYINGEDTVHININKPYKLREVKDR